MNLYQIRADWNRTRSLGITAQLNGCARLDVMQALGIRPEDITDKDDKRSIAVRQYEATQRAVEMSTAGHTMEEIAQALAVRRWTVWKMLHD